MTQASGIDIETRSDLRARMGAALPAPIDPFGRFLKLADVMESIGLSQAMIYKLMHDQRLPFPKPIKLGRLSLWLERDVIQWKAVIVDAGSGHAAPAPPSSLREKNETEPRRARSGR